MKKEKVKYVLNVIGIIAVALCAFAGSIIGTIVWTSLVR